MMISMIWMIRAILAMMTKLDVLILIIVSIVVDSKCDKYFWSFQSWQKLRLLVNDDGLSVQSR